MKKKPYFSYGFEMYGKAINEKVLERSLRFHDRETCWYESRYTGNAEMWIDFKGIGMKAYIQSGHALQDFLEFKELVKTIKLAIKKGASQ